MQQHPKAQIVVLTKNTHGLEVLLFQTNEKRGSFWQNITGTVEKNESYLLGALREFHEETGFGYDDVKAIELLSLDFTFTDNFQRNILEKCYGLLLKEKKSPTIDSSEHQNYKWMEVSKVTSENYKFPSNFKALEEAKKLW